MGEDVCGSGRSTGSCILCLGSGSWTMVHSRPQATSGPRALPPWDAEFYQAPSFNQPVLDIPDSKCYPRVNSGKWLNAQLAEIITPETGQP